MTIDDTSYGRRAIIGLSFLLFTLLLGRCSPVTVNYQYDKRADFRRLRSFAMKPSADPSAADKILGQAIEQELAAKGYKPAPADKADMLVAYHAAIQKRTIWQREFSPRGVPRGITPVTFKEGTIAIQFVDPELQHSVWDGHAEEAIDDVSQAREDIGPAVKKLLANFPPR